MELDISTASVVQVEHQPTKGDDCYSTMESKQRLLHQYEERLRIAKLHESPSMKKLLQQCEDHLISEYGKQHYLTKCIDDILYVDERLSVNPFDVYLLGKFIYRLCFHHILFSQVGNNLRDIPSKTDSALYTIVDICCSYTVVHFFNEEMTTSECMDSIKITWRQYPSLQHLIKLSYIHELIHSNDEFICNNIRYIVSIYKDELHQLLQSYHKDSINFDALIILLYFTILYDYREGATIIISLLNTIHFDNYKYKLSFDFIYDNFSDIDELFFQFDKFIEVLEQLKYGPILKLRFIYHCYTKFNENNDTEKLQVIIQHKTFILSEIEASQGETKRYFKLLSFLTISSNQTSNIKSIISKLKQDKHRFYDIKTVFCYFHSQLKEDQCSFLSKTVDIFLTNICENQSYSKLQALLEYSASLQHNYDENYIELLHNQQELILSMAAEISQRGNCREKAIYCEAVLCLICRYNKTCQTENRNKSVYAINKVKKSLSDHQKYCFGGCLQWLRSIGHEIYYDKYYHIINNYKTGYYSLIKCIVNLCEADISIFTSRNTRTDVNYALIKFITHEDKEHKLLKIINTMCELENSSSESTDKMDLFMVQTGPFSNEKGMDDIGTFTDERGFCRRYNKKKLTDELHNGLFTYVVSKCGENQVYLAQYILELNMTDKKADFLYKLTFDLGRLLQWEKFIHINVEDEQKKIIYQCICILRRAKKINNNLNIDPETYVKHFQFVHQIDTEVEKYIKSRQAILLVIPLLLLMNLTSGPHPRSAKLKKYLSLKYQYDKLILYLLWCSGDVEINPGPTLKKLRKLHGSEKERNWIKEIASTLLKLLKGLPEHSKPKSLWKDKPDGWPTQEPFYDPNNKSKVYNDDVKSDEKLLICLIDLCEQKLVKIPQIYQREVTLWIDNKKKELFEIYICRKETGKINAALGQLRLNQSPEDINTLMKYIGIEVNPNNMMSSNNSARPKTKGETITFAKRDFAGVLCKIINNKNPEEKCDGIWKKPPKDWTSQQPFFNPNNVGGRLGTSQDTALIDNLLKYCEDKGICIPAIYQEMTKAWKKRDMKDFCRCHTIKIYTAKIEHSLKYLIIESLLDKPCLKQMGLDVDIERCKSNSTTTASTNQYRIPPDPGDRELPTCTSESQQNFANQETLAIISQPIISSKTEVIQSSASESHQSLSDKKTKDSEIVSLVLSLSDDYPGTEEVKKKKRPCPDEDEHLTKRQRPISEDTSEPLKEGEINEAEIQKLLYKQPPPMAEISAIFDMDVSCLYSVMDNYELLNSEDNGGKENGDCLPCISELVSGEDYIEDS